MKIFNDSRLLTSCTLPEDLINYIIYNETAHNLERKHNENFWILINRKHPDYQTEEESLLAYWLLTHEITNKSEDVRTQRR